MSPSSRKRARPAPVDVRPSAKMRPLQKLIGTWITQGEIISKGKPTGNRFTFIDSYEWLPGGHFIAHTVNGSIDNKSLQGLEILGYDGRQLRATSYDSLGAVTHYRAQLKRREWSLAGAKERFLGQFDAAGKTLDGVWERRSARGTWQQMMHVTLTRIGT